MLKKYEKIVLKNFSVKNTKYLGFKNFSVKHFIVTHGFSYEIINDVSNTNDQNETSFINLHEKSWFRIFILHHFNQKYKIYIFSTFSGILEFLAQTRTQFYKLSYTVSLKITQMWST